MPKILWNMLSAKLSGSWRTNPFFKPGTEEPIRAPQALSKEQRYAVARRLAARAEPGFRPART